MSWYKIILKEVIYGWKYSNKLVKNMRESNIEIKHEVFFEDKLRRELYRWVIIGWYVISIDKDRDRKWNKF